MSLTEHPFHGPIHHLAYLVDDLEAAVEHLVSKFGAGPFFVLRDVAFEHLTSRGEPATFAHDSAFGQCGAVPVEVIQVKWLLDVVAERRGSVVQGGVDVTSDRVQERWEPAPLEVFARRL